MESSPIPIFISDSSSTAKPFSVSTSLEENIPSSPFYQDPFAGLSELMGGNVGQVRNLSYSDLPRKPMVLTKLDLFHQTLASDLLLGNQLYRDSAGKYSKNQLYFCHDGDVNPNMSVRVRRKPSMAAFRNAENSEMYRVEPHQ